MRPSVGFAQRSSLPFCHEGSGIVSCEGMRFTRSMIASGRSVSPGGRMDVLAGPLTTTCTGEVKALCGCLPL